MPKVTEQYKKEKRSEILEGALQAFGEKGYFLTTIDDIVNKTKLSKGAIYNYFNSKEEIYLNLLESSTHQFFDYLHKEFNAMDSTESKLRFLISKYKEQSFTVPTIKQMRVQTEFWLSASYQNELKYSMTERYQTFVQFLHELIQEGIQNGEFHIDVDSEAISALLLALRDGSTLHFSVIENNGMNKILWEVFEEMLFYYLKKF